MIRSGVIRPPSKDHVPRLRVTRRGRREECVPIRRQDLLELYRVAQYKPGRQAASLAQSPRRRMVQGLQAAAEVT
ncbi:hypothetical protein MTO96_007073 [Rhipicephalus appendiculatus]